MSGRYGSMAQRFCAALVISSASVFGSLGFGEGNEKHMRFCSTRLTLFCPKILKNARHLCTSSVSCLVGTTACIDNKSLHPKCRHPQKIKNETRYRQTLHLLFRCPRTSIDVLKANALNIIIALHTATLSRQRGKANIPECTAEKATQLRTHSSQIQVVLICNHIINLIDSTCSSAAQARI